MNLFLVRRPSAWADLSALKSSCVASDDAEGRDPNRLAGSVLRSQ